MKCLELVLLLLISYVVAIPTSNDPLFARRVQRRRSVGFSARAANNTGGNVQTSLTLDPSVIAPAFATGQAKNPGEANSLQSTNNFINFCVGKTITNGQQIQGGSCNPAPMGDIPSTGNMPSCKFQSPANGDTIPPNQSFTIKMAITGMQTGLFTNADASYFAAPQQLNGQGQIMGHSHVVIEKLSALNQVTPTNPSAFTFFKGLNAAASGGILTADVTGGLQAGAYKLSSINSAANHQPVIVPIAQHGSLDDAVYFTVGNAGGNTGGASGNASGAGGNAGGAGGNTQSNNSTNSGGAGGNNSANNGAGGNTGGTSSSAASSSLASSSTAGPSTTAASSTPTSSTSGQRGSGGKNSGGKQGGQRRKRFELEK